MWWEVVCVLVSHFHQDLASLEEESEYPQQMKRFLKYGQILDFIDSHYSDVSAPEVNFLKLGQRHNERVRRRDDTIIPLTPIPQDVTTKEMEQREIGATPLEYNYPMYTDHNEEILVATTTKTNVGEALRKPRSEDGLLIAPIQKPINAENVLREYLTVPTRRITDIAGQDFPKSTERESKYFEIENPLRRYDTVSKRKTADLHVMSTFDSVMEPATIGDRPIATILDATPPADTVGNRYLSRDTELDIGTAQPIIGARPIATNQGITPLATTIDSQNLSKDTENYISTVNNNDVTDLTRKTINYHTTVKDDTTYRTKTIVYQTIIKEDTSTTSKTTQAVIESTAIEKTTQAPQTTVKEITWVAITLGTVHDTSTENSIIFENASYSATTQAIVETSLDQITPTRSPSVKNTVYLKESTALSTSTVGTEETTHIIGEEESIQSTFVEPTEVSVGFPIVSDLVPYNVAELRQQQNMSTTEDYSNKKIDIPELLKMLDSVVYDDPNRFNLTQKFNESLQKFKIPTCETFQMPTTTEAPSTINFNDAKVVAKCFVCGLDVEGVPFSTACADAFSGDFIPLVPIDPKARGQIANYRKYCRYLDVNRVITTEEEPHSVFGRFTGGCSVRWVDLTSIYTQRSCRNRRRAVLGKHFGSKRMAKLEMALNEVDNGCIISPVATLLPLSRGISLYARFHACVCTGSWCNRAVVTTQWMTKHLIMFVFVTKVS